MTLLEVLQKHADELQSQLDARRTACRNGVADTESKLAQANERVKYLDERDYFAETAEIVEARKLRKSLSDHLDSEKTVLAELPTKHERALSLLRDRKAVEDLANAGFFVVAASSPERLLKRMTVELALNSDSNNSAVVEAIHLFIDDRRAVDLPVVGKTRFNASVHPPCLNWWFGDPRFTRRDVRSMNRLAVYLSDTQQFFLNWNL